MYRCMCVVCTCVHTYNKKFCQLAVYSTKINLACLHRYSKWQVLDQHEALHLGLIAVSARADKPNWQNHLLPPIDY